MIKWICQMPDGSLKLVASYSPPPNALCKAPEHFTSEMEPFFRLKATPDPKYPKRVSYHVSVDPSYNDWLKKKEEAKQASANLQEALLDGATIKHAHKRDRKHMNIFQRFFFSFIYPGAYQGKFQPFMKILFGKNHGFVVGGKFHV